MYDPQPRAESHPPLPTLPPLEARREVIPGQVFATFLLRCLEQQNPSLWLTLTCTLPGPSPFGAEGPRLSEARLPRITDWLGDLEPVTSSF